MRRDQHPAFLLELLESVEAILNQLTTTLSAARVNADATISDSPGGADGYRHVCQLNNGIILRIRRAERYAPNVGLQIEIELDGRRRLVPNEPPYLSWTPDDASLRGVAQRIAPEVIEAIITLQNGAIGKP